MKKFILPLLFAGASILASAKNYYDLTEAYLLNAQFDTNIEYGKTAEGELLSPLLQIPHGWTLNKCGSIGKGILTTVEVGSKILFSTEKITCPDSTYDKSTQGGLLVFNPIYTKNANDYSHVLSLHQEIYLPAGEYIVVTASYNGGSQSKVTSQLAWIPDEGSPGRSLVRVMNSRCWNTDSIFFHLEKPTKGKLYIGYSNTQTKSPIVFMDRVRLYRQDAALDDGDRAFLKERLEQLLSAAENSSIENDSPMAAAFRMALEKAYSVQKDSNADFSQHKHAIHALSQALKEYEWNKEVAIHTDARFARGATMAFGRMNVSDTKAIQAQGFVIGTHPQPTINDTKNQAVLENKGTIYWMKGLRACTKYYMRAYAISNSDVVAYGEVIPFYTIPQGQITWSLRDGGDETVRKRLSQATQAAVDWWNNLTSISGINISVGYNSGVPTAECSYGGWMSVGSNASYQATGTILHEMLHAVGVINYETQWCGSILRSGNGTGQWLGDRTTEVLRFWDNSNTSVLNGDAIHLWPYGINGAHEDNHTEQLYIANSLICQALGEDGLEQTSSHFALPYYAFQQEDEQKYYIKNEAESRGLYTAYLTENPNGKLYWKEASGPEVFANDSMAWYVHFTPDNQFYQFRNAATGKYITYTNGDYAYTSSVSSPSDAQDFQLMRGRVPVKEGSKTRGYWVIRHAARNPRCIVASTKGNIGVGILNLSNLSTYQRWLILRPEELAEYDSGISNITPNTLPCQEETKRPKNIYTLQGQLIRQGSNSTDGLEKGFYIVDEKIIFVP